MPEHSGLPLESRQNVASSPLIVAATLGLIDLSAVELGSRASQSVCLLTVLYAVGYQLLLGSAILLIGVITQRAARWRLGSVAVVVTTSLVFGAIFLPKELSVRAGKIAPPGLLIPTLLALTVAAALTIPAAAWIGRALGKTRLWVLAVPLAAILQFLNHVVLPRNYQAMHLLLTVLAAVAASASLWPRWRLTERARRVVPWGCAALGVAAVASAPPSKVLLELLSHEGISVAPPVALARAWLKQKSRPLRSAPSVGAAHPHSVPGLGLKNPVVVFLSVDAMRADILQTDQGSLPSFASFARSAVRFRVARTTAPSTMVALSALMMSRYYSQQRWEPYQTGGEDFPQKEEALRFPEALQRAGVRTTVIESGLWMAPEYGICRGFSDRAAVWRAPEPFAFAADIAATLNDRIAEVGQGSAFFFTHFVDAHAPYDLAGSAGTDRERYVRELALVDRAIDLILQQLSRSGLDDRAIVIVTADHGEAFGEHNNLTHGTTIYEEVVRVPLWVRIPGATARDVDIPVSLLDLAPTIVDLFALDIPGTFMGQTLVPVLLGSGTIAPRAIVIDSGRRHQAMISPDNLKVIRDLRVNLVELYDLTADPKETHSLYDDSVPSLPELDALEHFFDTNTLRSGGYIPPFRPP